MQMGPSALVQPAVPPGPPSPAILSRVWPGQREGTERVRAADPFRAPAFPGLGGQGGAPAPPGGDEKPEQVHQAAWELWGHFLSCF